MFVLRGFLAHLLCLANLISGESAVVPQFQIIMAYTGRSILHPSLGSLTLKKTHDPCTHEPPSYVPRTTKKLSRALLSEIQEVRGRGPGLNGLSPPVALFS
jgi:hypothetical protein